MKKSNPKTKDTIANLNRLKTEKSFKNIYRIVCDNGEKVAAEYMEGREIKKITYSQYEEMISAAASRLHTIMKEIPCGSYVGIKLENSHIWTVIFWSIMMSGYKPILLDAKGGKQQTAHLLEQSCAKAIIAQDDTYYDNVKTVDPIEILEGKSCGNFEPVWADEVALCTNGTTATSKIFIYDGESMSYQIWNVQKMLRQNNDIVYDDAPTKQLAFLPLHHIFGFTAVYMWYQFLGKTFIYLKDRALETILASCRSHGVTHLYCVPVFWNNLAQGIIRTARKQGKEKSFNRLCSVSLLIQQIFPKAGIKIASKIFKSVQANLLGPNIRFMINGGGHILPETLKIINAIGYPLYSGFGMTEAGITSVELSYKIKHRLTASLGEPMDFVNYRIDSNTKDSKDSKDRRGELLISAKSMHIGHMENGVLIPRDEEWIRTGDIGRYSDNRLFIEGRLKEVIINESGENVYPDELEDMFAGLNLVEQYCITGIAGHNAYEEITLVLKIGDDLASEEKIGELASDISDLNKTLPIYKKIKNVYLCLDELPIANGIKVQRQKLKRLIENQELAYQKLDLAQKTVDPITTVKEKGESDYIRFSEQELYKIKAEIRKLFAEVLFLNECDIGDHDNFINDLSGSSLDYIGLFTKLEEMYQIMLSDTESMSCSNIHDLSVLVLSKLKGLNSRSAMPAEETEPAGMRRITNFTDTLEYQTLRQRKQDLLNGNPFFIRHDGMLKDTSAVDGKTVINFASYNYLGLSGHPEAVEAAISATKKYGTSASGSRLIAGEKPLFQELEKAIAAWKHTEDAVVLVSGHATNVTFVGNFCNKNDLILYDALSHNSITQGCQLSLADTKAFPHNDYQTLEFLLKSSRDRFEKVMIIIEGAYSMDGDIAPIPEFVRLKKQYGAFLLVDEAHSSCVIGENGGGVDEYFNLKPTDIDVKMGTLSKGLGACGGYLATNRDLGEWMRYMLPGFAFSVGISPPVAAAALKGIEILNRDNSLVKKLQNNIATFSREANIRGFNTCLAKETAIMPILIGDDLKCYDLSRQMLERGISVPPVVYPAVPKGQSRLRFCLVSNHNEEQIIFALNTLLELANAYRGNI